MRTCGNCGVRNPDDAVFCVSCNYFLEWSDGTAKADGAEVPPPPATPLPAEPPPTAAAPAPLPAAPAPTPAVPAPRPAAQPRPTPQPPAARAAPVPDGAADALVSGQQLLAQAADGLRRGRRLAVARDRPDLAQALDGAASRLDQRQVGIAVVGEFKRGKSTLVNALLQTAVCPVDADEVTVVPTFVRYGETAQATAYFEQADDAGQPLTEAVPVDKLAEYVAETGNPGNRRGLRSLEVRVPRRLLKTGMCLIDTPGVGGLDSAHGIITLGALDRAHAMLFVCDASQELTAPELAFLRDALQRCPLAACVITKTDLYPEWRRIAELNTGHLRTAGLDLPVISVSSFLRLASRRDPALADESGYAGLIQFLAGALRAANEAAVAAAARDVGFVADQLDQQISAEKSVLSEPAAARQVVADLVRNQDRAAGLVTPTANWQQMLSDGVQDLVADVEHNLQERLRTVLRDAEGIIDASDPKDSWGDIEVWLRRNVVAAAVANSDMLAERTRDLTIEVARRFDFDAGTPADLRTGNQPDALAGVNLASVESLMAPGGRFGTMLMAARTALFVPMVLFGVAGSLLGAVVAAPLSLLLAAGIGQKIIRDEKKRQIAHRRQQAKLAARRYVEEVSFIMNKESRDALRRTQRLLRDDFHARAMSLHRSASSALASARQAMQMPEPQRRQRISQLAAEADQVREVGERAAELARPTPVAAR